MYHDGNISRLPASPGLTDNHIRAAVASPLMARIFMARKRLLSYLRTERKRSGLTQKELALLVGAKSGAQLSRFERLRRVPPTEALIALMIIFKKGPQELIPSVYDRILKLIHLRADELHEELQGDRRRITKAKLDTLEDVLIDDEHDNQAII